MISKLFPADDLVLLASTAEDLQRLLNRFATECDKEGMKISTPKTEVMTLSLDKPRNAPCMCTEHNSDKSSSSSISASCSQVMGRRTGKLTVVLTRRA